MGLIFKIVRYNQLVAEKVKIAEILLGIQWKISISLVILRR